MSKFIALQRLYQPWLITPATYEGIRDTILAIEPDVEIPAPKQSSYTESNGVALLSLKGTMMKNPTPLEQVFLGATCTQAFCNQAIEINKNPSIKGVLLDVDSGGGSVQGVIEASQAIRELHKNKPVIAYTDGLMASASYWVGSQATAIVGSPSSRVGSIGVYVPVVDYSRQFKEQGIDVSVISNKDGIHKGAGVEGTSLSEDQKAQVQAEVEEIYGEFKDAVLRARNVPSDAMQGQAFMGKTAKEKNLIDAVGTFEEALYLLDNEIKNRS